MKDTQLSLIWTSADKETATNMALMYAGNSRAMGWWKNVRLIIWGPSVKLAARDADIQERLREMKEYGVELWACKACSDNYGLSDALEVQGIEVFYVGEAVTEMLRSGDWTTLTV